MRRLACLILMLAALGSPIHGAEETRLVSPFGGPSDGPSDGAELSEGSKVALAGPARTALPDSPDTGSEPAPRPVLDEAPIPRPAPPVPVRLLIHRFNE